MGIKQSLLECIPDAYYSDGTKANCLIFKICNMFDVDSQSFKEVSEKKNMEIKSRKQAIEDYDLLALRRLRKEGES